MARALELAEGGRYTARPNPRVGCVLVKDGVIIAEGFHRKAGEAHAEAAALAKAGAAARGATAYVTLEPCAHQGRTPPCADALIAAGVSRVVHAIDDPNPRVQGGGANRLRAAGILSEHGLLAAEARALNRGFLMRCEHGRPFVTLKLGMSLDGRVALANGQSQWITGAESRADVQRLRAGACAVLTGVDTVIADDPRLDVRDPRFDLDGLAPARVVLDSTLRTPVAARLFSVPGEVILCTVNDAAPDAPALRAKGAQIEVVSARHQRPDPAMVLARLAARGMNEILVEAGPTVAGSLLAAGLVDELVLYVAPMLLGAGARDGFAWPPLAELAAAPRFTRIESARCGEDERLILRPHHP
jgi:diaminohydroxyphosphoribosylaminopyrimidine deaminase/5-amino-6-(5-phosphoribosylamino)uracil reductase